MKTDPVCWDPQGFKCRIEKRTPFWIMEPWQLKAPLEVVVTVHKDNLVGVGKDAYRYKGHRGEALV